MSRKFFMKIYTKTGDGGETSLCEGKRVPKDDIRVEAYGTVDELNSTIGMGISICDLPEVCRMLIGVQQDLFVIGSELACPGNPKLRINPKRITELEQSIDKFSLELPELRNFILPGGAKEAAILHLARGICRRAERRVVALSRGAEVNKDITIYLNRLGDLLFVTARYINHRKGEKEVIWKS